MRRILLALLFVLAIAVPAMAAGNMEVKGEAIIVPSMDEPTTGTDDEAVGQDDLLGSHPVGASQVYYLWFNRGYAYSYVKTYSPGTYTVYAYWWNAKGIIARYGYCTFYTPYWYTDVHIAWSLYTWLPLGKCFRFGAFTYGSDGSYSYAYSSKRCF